MTSDVLSAASAFVEWLASLDQGLVLLFTALSTALETTFLLGLFVPGEAVVMLAASLPSGPEGFLLAVLVGTAGAMLGQVGGYLVGRGLGPRMRRSRLGRRIGEERWARAEAYLHDRGAAALVAVRFLAVIHAVVPIVAGSVRMPFGRFFGWSALGTTIWVAAFAGLGTISAGADQSGGAGVVLTAVGASCLGLVPLAGRLVRRRPAGTSGTAGSAPATAQTGTGRSTLATAQIATAKPAVTAARGGTAQRAVSMAQVATVHVGAAWVDTARPAVAAVSGSTVDGGSGRRRPDPRGPQAPDRRRRQRSAALRDPGRRGPARPGRQLRLRAAAVRRA